MGSVFTLTAVFRLAGEGPLGEAEEPAVPPGAAAGAEGGIPPAPVSPEEAAPPDAVPPANAPRLVVAEDTAVTALFLHETLTHAGYAVHTANRGEDALFLIRKLCPDAVLLDMRLPDMSGLDIAQSIRSGGLGVPSETPILVLTATLDPGDENALRRLHIDGWLLKPVQTGRLTQAVADLLRRTENASDAASPVQTPPAAAPHETADMPPSPAPTPEAVSATAGRLPNATAPRAPKGDKTNAEPLPSAAPQAAAPAPAAAHAEAFDAEAALSDLGSSSLLARLIGIFLSEAPNVRASLAFFGEESADAGRLPELRRHAHSLKNGAGMLHLEHLRLVCTELEHAAATDDAGRVPELTRAALDALDRAVEALQRQGGA